MAKPQSQDALQRRLMGLNNANGPVGQFARGKSVYSGGSPNPAGSNGGLNYGRAPRASRANSSRRLQQYAQRRIKRKTNTGLQKRYPT